MNYYGHNFRFYFKIFGPKSNLTYNYPLVYFISEETVFTTKIP